MQTLSRILQALLLTALIVLVCLVIVIVHQVRPKVVALIDESTVALKTLDAGMSAETEKLKATTAEAQKTEHAIRGAVDSFRKMTDRTDRRLNEEILPSANTAILGANELLRSADVATNRSLPALDNLGEASASLSRMLDDSSVSGVKRSIEHVDEATVSLANTAKHADAIAANADEASALALARFKQALKPASLAKTIFMRALGLAGPAAQIATAVK